MWAARIPGSTKWVILCRWTLSLTSNSSSLSTSPKKCFVKHGTLCWKNDYQAICQNQLKHISNRKVPPHLAAFEANFYPNLSVELMVVMMMITMVISRLLSKVLSANCWQYWSVTHEGSTGRKLQHRLPRYNLYSILKMKKKLWL